jgi:hypothetical protein
LVAIVGHTRNRGAVEKFGREMERRRRWRLAPVDTAPPLGRVHQESSTLETKGSEAITAAGCCAVPWR